MGKHADLKGDSGSTSDKSNPHQKWVKMLNVLDYHRWHYVKKMLPHKKKRGEERDSTGGTSAGSPDDDVNGDVCILTPEERDLKESSSTKKGRASRIKAKFAKEILKKRGRHKRSSTDTNGVSSSYEDCEKPLLRTVESSKDKQSCETVNVDLECSDEEQMYILKLKHLEGQPKELEDAMDVLSMNRDFFMKVLQDPESSLAKHFMVQQASGKWKGIDRSRTFHRNAPSDTKQNNRKALNPLKGNTKEPHFRSLRHKIRHVTRESRKDRRRVAMDAVLDKVPFGRQCSETKKGVAVKKLDVDKDGSRHVVERSHSLKESVERYNVLYQTSFKEESMNLNSNRLINASRIDEEEDPIDGRDHGDSDYLVGIQDPCSSSMLGSDLEEDAGSPEKSVLSSEDHSSSQQQDTGTDLFSLSGITADLGNFEAKCLDHLQSAICHIRVKTKDQGDFNYVKDILQLSGYTSIEPPMDPSLVMELEGCALQEPDYSALDDQGVRCDRLLLFDLINEVLVSIYARSMAYWGRPLVQCSRIRSMPKGYRVLEEVWECVSWCLNSGDDKVENISMSDIGKDDEWMNLQFEGEGVGLEVEDLIFQDLVMEIVSAS